MSAGGADPGDLAGAEGVDEPPMVVAHHRGVLPGEGEPWPFYQQFGFQPTGEIDDGEIMLRLSFSAR